METEMDNLNHYAPIVAMAKEAWQETPASTLPSAVMALDFHDSRPVKRDFMVGRRVFMEISEEFEATREEAEQAREDAWRESEPMKEANAVVRGSVKGEDIE